MRVMPHDAYDSGAMTPRLASALLTNALVRQCHAVGGSAAVLAKGDPVSGAILAICCEKGVFTASCERVLQGDGRYVWQATGAQDLGGGDALSPYIERRKRFDPDLWVIELDIPNAPQLIVEWAGDA